MARYYQNDNLYSNSTRSSRNGGGTWVYMNGELYHYGRPGMEWGKHLPGTDWWKEKVGQVKSHFQTAYNSNLKRVTTNGTNPSRLSSVSRALGSTAKYVGQGLMKYGKRLPGHMAKEFKNIGKNLMADFKEVTAKIRERGNSFANRFKSTKAFSLINSMTSRTKDRVNSFLYKILGSKYDISPERSGLKNDDDRSKKQQTLYRKGTIDPNSGRNASRIVSPLESISRSANTMNRLYNRKK